MLDEERGGQVTSTLTVQALALVKLLEQTLLDAERDAAAVHFSFSTVEGEALAMEEYRTRTEALFATAESAKLGACLEADADMDIVQAQNYIVVVSAAATKCVELKQQTQSTDKLKVVASSGQDAAEKVRLASVLAATAKVDIRSLIKSPNDGDGEKQVGEDLVHRVDACAERIFHLQEFTQQNASQITKRCRQALAARTQGDTAVMRTVRISKELSRGPNRARSFTDLHCRSGEFLLSSCSNDSQAEGRFLVPEMQTLEFDLNRSPERSRAVRAAAVTLRAQRDAIRSKLLENPVFLPLSAEPVAEELEFPVEAPSLSVLTLPKTPAHTITDTITEEDVNAMGSVLHTEDVSLPEAIAPASVDTRVDVPLNCLDSSDAADCALQAERASCEASLRIISAKEASLSERVVYGRGADSVRASQRVELVKERVEALMEPSIAEPDREHKATERAHLALHCTDNVQNPLQSVALGCDVSVSTSDPLESLVDDVGTSSELLCLTAEKVYRPGECAETVPRQTGPAEETLISAAAITQLTAEADNVTKNDDPCNPSEEVEGTTLASASIAAPCLEGTSSALVNPIEMLFNSPRAVWEDSHVAAKKRDEHLEGSVPVFVAGQHEAHDPPQEALSEMEILQEVARIAEAEVESCFEAVEKVILSAEGLLRSAEEAESIANQAHALAKQELRTFTKYRSCVEETHVAVREALQVITKEARLCEEEEKSSQLHIQTCDDTFLAARASIQEELSLLSEPVLLDDSEVSLRVWTTDRASVLAKIAAHKENMLTAACRREEVARDHVNYVCECSYGMVARDKADQVEEHTSAVTNKKSTLATELAREASDKSSAAARHCADLQTQLLDGLESADIAVETFQEAMLALVAEAKVCRETGVGAPVCDLDAIAVLFRHTQRRLDVITCISAYVEKIINLNEHTQHLVQKVFTACDNAFATMKDGNALVMRCGVAAAKASALATQTRQAEVIMIAGAEAALARALEQANKSRQASEQAHAAVVEAETTRSAAEAATQAKNAHHRPHQLDMHQLSRSYSHHSVSEDARVPSLILNYGSSSLSPRVSVVSSPPHSSRLSNVSSPPHSARLSNVSSPTVSALMSIVSSPLHSARILSVPSASPPLSARKGSEHHLVTPQEALERVEELRNRVRAAAARAEESTLSAERVAHALQHTVQNVEFAADAAREASSVAGHELAAAQSCRAHLENLNANACGAVDAACGELGAREESKRVLAKRITIADNVLQDEEASVEEELHLLEATFATSAATGRISETFESSFVAQRSQLLSRVHAAGARREQQAQEHVTLVRASTSAEEAQKHADHVAFSVSEAICLQPKATDSDHLTRLIHSSAQAAQQVSAAAASAFERNHEVCVALEETHKACDVALHAAIDLRVWKAECDQLGVDCSHGELQNANNMPFFTQRCREAARQVEVMTNHILMLQELTQHTAAQVAHQSQQINNIRSQAELTVRRVTEASREAAALVQHIRRVEAETIALAEAVLVRVRKEANTVHETAPKTAHIGSATKGSTHPQSKEPQPANVVENHATQTHKPSSTLSPFEVVMGSTDSEDNRDDAIARW